MIVTAYLASQYKKLIEFALFYAVVSAVIGTINHLEITSIFINALIVLSVSFFHLSVLVRLKEHQIPWILMLLAFPAVMLTLAFKVLMIFG